MIPESYMIFSEKLGQYKYRFINGWVVQEKARIRMGIYLYIPSRIKGQLKSSNRDTDHKPSNYKITSSTNSR